MSEIRERLEEIQRLSGDLDSGPPIVDVLAEIHEDATRALALLPTEGEPVAWKYRYRHKDDIWSSWRLSDVHPREEEPDLDLEIVPLFTTPQESTEAIEWVRRAMTHYHGMRQSIGAMMWRRGEAILGEEVEGLPPRESAEVERLREAHQGYEHAATTLAARASADIDDGVITWLVRDVDMKRLERVVKIYATLSPETDG